jgi:4a-hydroxytetrahydrobiopterin dehydratase
VSRREKLSDAALRDALADLPGWTLAGGKLHREYRFADFGAAFAFMTRVALVAEKLDHHPDWQNVYDRVVVDLWTHDAGGITERDLTLARRMQELAGTAGSTRPR